MKKRLLFITTSFFSVLIFSNFYQKKTGTTILKAMTYNIRYDNPKDGKDNWKHRKTHLAAFIEKESPDVLGIQEGLFHQVEELETLLSIYSYVGVGRDDGDKKGEFTPIFYKKALFQTLKTGVFWLSDTPDVIGSVGWDAALPRIATWVLLENRKNQKQYFILNTHFDHRGQQARVESAKLILKKIEALGGVQPIVIMGDFNVTTDNEAYKTLAYSDSFSDAKSISITPPKGRNGTFNAFKMKHQVYQIDYIFVNKKVKVNSYEVASPTYDGRQVSDHYPVMVELEI